VNGKQQQKRPALLLRLLWMRELQLIPLIVLLPALLAEFCAALPGSMRILKVTPRMNERATRPCIAQSTHRCIVVSVRLEAKTLLVQGHARHCSNGIAAQHQINHATLKVEGGREGLD
jgi:hypothetical protein